MHILHRIWNYERFDLRLLLPLYSSLFSDVKAVADVFSKTINRFKLIAQSFRDCRNSLYHFHMLFLLHVSLWTGKFWEGSVFFQSCVCARVFVFTGAGFEILMWPLAGHVQTCSFDKLAHLVTPLAMPWHPSPYRNQLWSPHHKGCPWPRLWAQPPSPYNNPQTCSNLLTWTSLYINPPDIFRFFSVGARHRGIPLPLPRTDLKAGGWSSTEMPSCLFHC